MKYREEFGKLFEAAVNLVVKERKKRRRRRKKKKKRKRKRQLREEILPVYDDGGSVASEQAQPPLSLGHVRICTSPTNIAIA